jgi:hypothetical protein
MNVLLPSSGLRLSQVIRQLAVFQKFSAGIENFLKLKKLWNNWVFGLFHRLVF